MAAKCDAHEEFHEFVVSVNDNMLNLMMEMSSFKGQLKAWGIIIGLLAIIIGPVITALVMRMIK
jgi:hypothetical protein